MRNQTLKKGLSVALAAVISLSSVSPSYITAMAAEEETTEAVTENATETPPETQAQTVETETPASETHQTEETQTESAAKETEIVQTETLAETESELSKKTESAAPSEETEGVAPPEETESAAPPEETESTEKPEEESDKAGENQEESETGTETEAVTESEAEPESEPVTEQSVMELSASDHNISVKAWKIDGSEFSGMEKLSAKKAEDSSKSDIKDKITDSRAAAYTAEVPEDYIGSIKEQVSESMLGFDAFSVRIQNSDGKDISSEVEIELIDDDGALSNLIASGYEIIVYEYNNGSVKLAEGDNYIVGKNKNGQAAMIHDGKLADSYAIFAVDPAFSVTLPESEMAEEETPTETETDAEAEETETEPGTEIETEAETTSEAESETEAAKAQQTMDYADGKLSVISDGITLNGETLSYEGDMEVSLDAENTGNAQADTMTLKATVTFPDGSVIPEGIHVQDGKVIDGEGNVVFELSWHPVPAPETEEEKTTEEADGSQTEQEESPVVSSVETESTVLTGSADTEETAEGHASITGVSVSGTSITVEVTADGMENAQALKSVSLIMHADAVKADSTDEIGYVVSEDQQSAREEADSVLTVNEGFNDNDTADVEIVKKEDIAEHVSDKVDEAVDADIINVSSDEDEADSSADTVTEDELDDIKDDLTQETLDAVKNDTVTDYEAAKTQPSNGAYFTDEDVAAVADGTVLDVIKNPTTVKDGDEIGVSVNAVMSLEGVSQDTVQAEQDMFVSVQTVKLATAVKKSIAYNTNSNKGTDFSSGYTGYINYQAMKGISAIYKATQKQYPNTKVTKDGNTLTIPDHGKELSNNNYALYIPNGAYYNGKSLDIKIYAYGSAGGSVTWTYSYGNAGWSVYGGYIYQKWVFIDPDTKKSVNFKGVLRVADIDYESGNQEAWYVKTSDMNGYRIPFYKENGKVYKNYEDYGIQVKENVINGYTEFTSRVTDSDGTGNSSKGANAYRRLDGHISDEAKAKTENAGKNENVVYDIGVYQEVYIEVNGKSVDLIYKSTGKWGSTIGETGYWIRYQYSSDSQVQNDTVINGKTGSEYLTDAGANTAFKAYVMYAGDEAIASLPEIPGYKLTYGWRIYRSNSKGALKKNIGTAKAGDPDHDIIHKQEDPTENANYYVLTAKYVQSDTTDIVVTKSIGDDNTNTDYFTINTSAHKFVTSDEDDGYAQDVSGWTMVLSGTANDTKTTNSEGIAEWSNVTPGTYTVTESGVDTRAWSISGDNGLAKAVVTGSDTEWEIINTVKTGSIYLKKTVDDPTGQYNAQSFTFNISGTSYLGDTINTNVSLNENGEFYMDGVPYGEYTVTENYPTNQGAEWWETSGSGVTGNTATVYVNDSTNGSGAVTFNNKHKIGNIVITKEVVQNGSSYAAKNFGFRVVGTSALNSSVNQLVYPEGDGTTGSVTLRNVPYGTYTVTEEVLPDGTWDSTPAGRSMTITLDSSNNPAAAYFKNIYETGTVKIIKTMTDPSQTYTTPAGFTFTMTKCDANGNTGSNAVYAARTTDASGTITIENVPVGYYKVVETGGPDFTGTIPYWWDSSSVPASGVIQVRYNETTEASFKNIYKTGTAKIIKTVTDPSQNYTTAAGFTFTLTKCDENGNTGSNKVYATRTTDASGSITIENMPIGYYKVVETSGPDFTGTIPDWWDSSSVPASGIIQIKYNETSEIQFTNIYKTNDVKIKKTVTYSRSIDGDSYSAKGFWFHLEGTSSSGKTISLYGATDENGEIAFKDIPIGEHYTVTEVGTPDNGLTEADYRNGKSSIPDWWNPLINGTTSGTKITDVKVTYKTPATQISMTNKLKTGTVTITKVVEKARDDKYNKDAETEPRYSEKLSGFAFHMTGTSLSGKTIDAYAVTDDNGIAKFEHYPISGGSGYTVVEVSCDDVKKAAEAGNVTAKAIQAKADQDLKRYVAPKAFTVACRYDDEKHEEAETKYTQSNILVKWRITIRKTDYDKRQDALPQQLAAFEGAVYELHDGDKLIDTYVTDKNGEFTTDYYALGDNWYLIERKPPKGYKLDETKYHINASEDDISNEKEYNDTALDIPEANEYGAANDANHMYETVQKGQFTIYKISGDRYETDLNPLANAGFRIYAVSDLENAFNASLSDMSDAQIVQWCFDNVRDSEAQTYIGKLRDVSTATVYAYSEYDDVKNGKLVKDGSELNKYCVPELMTGSDGVLQTPQLPYGRYVIFETTVPKSVTAVAPVVITVDHDGNDYKPLYLDDTTFTGRLKIVKKDIVTGNVVATEGAKYVIHDVDGAYFNLYMEDRTTAEKERYKRLFGDLVVDYSAKNAGSYANPFSTQVQEDDGVTSTYVMSPELPAGTYELEEVTAPYGYVKQGSEGLYRTRSGKTIWEVQDASDEKWSNYAKYITGDDTGTWVANAEKRNQKVRIYLGSGTASYDTTKRVFVAEAMQSNDPAVGKLSVYAEGQYLTGVQYNGTTITERVGEEFPGYTDVKDESGNDISEFRNPTFEYETRGIEGASFTVTAAEDIWSNEGTPNAVRLFSAGDVVTTLTTDLNGEAWTGSIETPYGTYYGLPIGKYTVTQTMAGNGFALSKENAQARTFEITYDGEEVPITFRDEAYVNPRQMVDIEIAKYDAETKERIAGAVFGLYAAEDIQNADGMTIIRKDDLVMISETTQDSLLAKFDARYRIVHRSMVAEDEMKVAMLPARLDVNDSLSGPSYDKDGLPLAKYYVKEISSPKGYTTTDDVVDVNAAYNSDQREVLSFVNDSYDGGYKFVNEQTKTVIKVADYDNLTELDGAELTLTDQDGNKVTDYVTVHNGGAVIRKLEINKTYTITEVKPRVGYSDEVFETAEDYISSYAKAGEYTDKDQNSWKPATDVKASRQSVKTASFKVNDVGGVQVVAIRNKAVKADIAVTKQGEVPITEVENGVLKTVSYQVKGLPGAEYDVVAIEDINHPDGYTGVVVANETKVAHLVTDNTGRAQVNNLWLGKYRIVETKAPRGYVRKTSETTKEIDLSAYYKENYYDKGDYSETFEWTAEYTNPRQKTDIGGDEPEDPDNPPELEELFGKAGVYKIGVDGGDESPVAGAEFTLYAKDNIVDIFGNVVIPAGTKIETAVSGDDGRAAFKTDLPIGVYSVKETRHPYGYYSTDAEVVFTLDEYADDDSVRIVRARQEIRNPITKLILYLEDDKTFNELADAVLTITDSEGKEFTVITTENTNGEGRVIKGLNPDETYTITETKPRDGYVDTILNKDGNEMGEGNAIKVVIPDKVVDSSLSNVPEDVKLYLYNMFVTGNITITKEGEVLTQLNTSVEQKTLCEKLVDWAVTTARYELAVLSGVEFTVYAKEDIVHPDGVTGTVFKAGDVVKQNVRGVSSDAVASTDVNGDLKFTQLYLGSYEIKETSIPEGFVKNDTVYDATLAYKDAKTEQVDAMESIIKVINERQKVKIRVTKKDIDTDKEVAGAVFGLYAAQDIKNKDGDVVAEEGKLLMTAQADDNGVAVFEADMPLAKYQIGELAQPLGYTKSFDRIDVDASWKSDGKETVEISEDFKNEITKVEISKVEEGTDQFIEGASLEVLDNDGNVIDSWTTTAEKHMIKGLIVGHTYTLKETSPAKGYVTAEDVKFTVEDRKEDGSYEPQQVVMEDEPTKVEIKVWEKSYNGTTKDLAGVRYHVTDADGNVAKTADGKVMEFTSAQLADYVEKLPIGDYTITTDNVPEGYVKPGDLKITVKDTPQLQHFDLYVPTIIIRVYATDKGTGEEIKDGVKVTITDKDGKVIEENVPLEHIEEYFHKGDYTVTVTELPAGYVIPEGTAITVKEIETLQEYVIPIDYTKTRTVAVDKDTDKEIPEGVIVTILDKDGNVVEENVPLEHLKDHVPTGDYTIRVTNVPAGYVIPENTVVTVKPETDLQTFEIPLEHIKITVMTYDVDTDKDVEGCRYDLYDNKGNVVEENVDVGKILEYIDHGDYVVKIVSVPDGYIIPEDTNITVKQIAELQTFRIPLEHIKITVMTYDVDTDKDVEGCRYDLYDNEGNVVEENVDVGKILEYIDHGDYVVKIVSVPDGYIIPKDTDITVKQIAEQQQFRIPLEHVKIQVRPVDENGKPVDNVKMQLLDSKGKVVGEWTSSGWKLFEYITPGKYKIHVLSVPDGYLVPEDKEIEVKNIEDLQSFEIVLKKKPVQEAKPTTGDDLDTRRIMLITALVVILAAVGGITVKSSRKKENE